MKDITICFYSNTQKFTSMDDNKCYAQDPETGEWNEAIPEPYYYGFFPWLLKRATGYRDEYGRKAQLFWK